MKFLAPVMGAYWDHSRNEFLAILSCLRQCLVDAISLDSSLQSTSFGVKDIIFNTGLRLKWFLRLVTAKRVLPQHRFSDLLDLIARFG